MQVFLLPIAMLAMIVFGFFLMRRLDVFLEKNRSVQAEQFQTGANVLRIGFSNPLVADSILDAIEKYSGQYSDIDVCLFQGDAEDLLKKLAVHKLDIVFLPEQVEIPPEKNYNRLKVILKPVPVIMKYGGLPIEPITDGSMEQTVVWLEETGASAAKNFMKNMEDGNAKTESGSVITSN